MEEGAPRARRRRRTVIGVVTGDRMHKTLVVTEERHVRHALYGKVVRRFTKYKVHDEKGEGRVGDHVEIVETRPLSKTKCWRLVRVMRRNEAEVTTGSEVGTSAEAEAGA
ncbi:MAG: 30S ribosomal protein S17 [Planctomycetes bacterium]|nr:30S ribosomal protein S17 [Planctomycetota bacterium]